MSETVYIRWTVSLRLKLLTDMNIRNIEEGIHHTDKRLQFMQTMNLIISDESGLLLPCLRNCVCASWLFYGCGMDGDHTLLHHINAYQCIKYVVFSSKWLILNCCCSHVPVCFWNEEKARLRWNLCIIHSVLLLLLGIKHMYMKCIVWTLRPFLLSSLMKSAWYVSGLIMEIDFFSL